MIAGVDMGTIYTIITLNGRGYAFDADEVTELNGILYFDLDGETVAQFRKDCLSGWFITRYDYGEEDE